MGNYKKLIDHAEQAIGLLNTNQFATTDVCILLSILKRRCSKCFSLYAILKGFLSFCREREVKWTVPINFFLQKYQEWCVIFVGKQVLVIGF